MINLDELAEMHYADRDPAYQNEDALEEQREKIENRALTVFENSVKQALWSLDEDELKMLAQNTDSICEWIEEVLKEYE